MVSPSIKLDLKPVGLDLSQVFPGPIGSRLVVGLAPPWVSPCSGSRLTVGLTPPWVSAQPWVFVGFCWGLICGGCGGSQWRLLVALTGDSHGLRLPQCCGCHGSHVFNGVNVIGRE
uniref:Uncharacterized protein n=1 Tax=Fagus sylvatica TaxID=28930 RepID=A0A2N9F7T6_FAGSY